ncbi:MAG: hypothetical protein ACOH5I_07880 [Oligoflexus sp.]
MKSQIILVIMFMIWTGCTKKNFNRNGLTGVQSGQQGENAGQTSNVDATQEAENMLLDSALIWKRYRAFEQGLMAGLDLAKGDLCQEAGQFSCVDQVHLTVLGGNEPYDNAQYERAEKPSVLTAVAVDRVLLTACSRRAAMDKTAGTAATVFKHFPLTDQAANAEQVKAQVTDLYRRLLARDPNAQELEAASAFAGQISGGEKLAVALCYAIGTSAENVFL